MKARWIGLVAMFAPCLVGCGTPRLHDLLPAEIVAYAPRDISAERTIFVATTRARAADRREVFSGRRSPDLAFAKVEVTVPRDHKPGKVERPKRGATVDPARYFAAQSIDIFPGEAPFQAALRKSISAHGGRALIFIHGYRTPFDGAVFRMAQIINDGGYAGTPILFSWASGDRTADYVYDSNSATAARDGLEETFRMVVRAGATKVDVIAHSMGNWVTMEALRQLAFTDDRDLDGRLGDVVLASPDIDVDVFKSQMRRYGKPDRPFFVLVASDDRALRISRILAGGRPRVGDYSDTAELEKLGLVVVDLSHVKSGDRLNHTRFADNPALVKLIGERIADDDLGEGDPDDLQGAVDSVAQGALDAVTGG